MSINRSTVAIPASAPHQNTHKHTHTQARIRVHHVFTQKHTHNVYTNVCIHTQKDTAACKLTLRGTHTRMHAHTHTHAAATAAVAFNVDRWQIKKTY